MSSEDLSEEELELIRQRKMSELQRSMVDEQRTERAQKQLEAQKQNLLRAILTPEARQRLTNIRMVRPEFAEQLELQLIQIAQSGRLKIPLTDEQLKETLKRLQSQRRDITIRRI
jgi:programmed cell death protein 5